MSSKVSDIYVLATGRAEFVIEVRLTVSFLRVLARKFIDWRGCWIMVASRNSKCFSFSSTLTQLVLSLAVIILRNLDILLGIFLRKRQIEVNTIRHLEYWSDIDI